MAVETLQRDVKVVESITEIGLEELGRELGVPIRVRPWWGSIRGQKYWLSRSADGSRRETGFFHKWQCPAIGDYYMPTAPRVQRDTIIVHQGQCGVRWGKRTHAHRQLVNVLSVQPGAMLVEVVVRGNGKCHRENTFILGVDDKRPYVARVGPVQTLAEAFEWLKPLYVQRAEQKGLEVKRQGDWYFIPVDDPDFVEKWGYKRVETVPLHLVSRFVRTRHYPEDLMTSDWHQDLVRGEIKSQDHPTLVLEDWHLAVRNRAIRRDPPNNNSTDVD